MTVGKRLTLAQLTGLELRPGLDGFGHSSAFAFTVSDPEGDIIPASATLTIAQSDSAVRSGLPVGLSSHTPGDYNSVLGKALNISVPSEAPSPSVTVQVTELPTNGTVVLSDGTTPVSLGQSLTQAQAAGLRFKPNGIAQSSHFDFAEVIPGRPPTPKTINLPFDPNTRTITPAATAAPASTAPTTAAPRKEQP